MRRTSSREQPPKGCGITAIGSPACPSARAWARPRVWKAVEHTATAAQPCCAASMLSWTLHDAQDPQSPDPAMTTSHSPVIAAIISGVAAIEAEVLRHFTTRAAP